MQYQNQFIGADEQLNQTPREAEKPLMKVAAQGMVFQLADGSIQGCNADAESILGLTAEQLQGWTSAHSPWQAIHEDGSPFPGDTHPAMVALRTGEACLNVVMGLYKPEGELVWILINAQPLFRANQTVPYGVVSTFTEITEQMRSLTPQLSLTRSNLQSSRKPSTTATEPQKQRTILVVEDYFIDQETYQRYLLQDSEYQYTILTAQTGEQGLQLCQEQKPDVILLDYLLPDLDGLEFLALLSNQDKPIDPPVIMLTGQGDEAIAVQAMKQGASDYLVKGRITPEKLRIAVNCAIEQSLLRARLQQSEERLQLALEAANIGIWEWKIPTNTLVWSDLVGPIFGFPQGFTMPTYEAFLDRVYLEDRDNVAQTVASQLKAGTDDEIEFRIVWPDGTLHWASAKAQVYRDQMGQPLRMIGTVIDITESKQAELERQLHFMKERLIAQIAQDIRRSLNLEEILNTTVSEVRQFLASDRTIIFQLQPDGSGTVVTESVRVEWTPILSTNIYDPCFVDSYVEPYRRGLVTAKTDIYNAGIDPCHLQLLARFQVRANLVVPILQDEHLWGLLIVHQCSTPREWQQVEIDLLKQLATQVGIALQQAKLFELAKVEIAERKQAEKALRQQTERERLVAEIAQRIRQTLSLEEVLNTTVSEVRKFLETERVFIYRFEINWSGIVVVESVAEGFLPILDVQVEDTYFQETHGEDYRQGRIQATADIYSAGLTECHIDLLAQFQVRANLAVPILQGENLWGLLVANQCSSPREWQPLEIDLLKQLATQVGIAIQQSELYQQAQIEVIFRQQAETALRRSQERLQQMVDTSEVGIGFGKSTGEILEINDALLGMLGYTREEFQAQGLNWKTMSSPQYAELDRQAMEELCQTGTVEPIEKELIGKDGTRIPVLISASRLQGEEDEHVAFIVDLTENKRVEASLRESEARFRGVVESDLIGIIFWNIAGQITDGNDAFIRMIGYSREELQSGQVRWDEITPPEYQESDRKKFEILQATGTIPPVEKEYIRKDGSRIPIILGCAFLPGYRDRGVAYVVDNSDRKQWEQEREALLAGEQAARAEAEKANQIKDEFLAVLSHELRSPLNPILGWSRLLQTHKLNEAKTAEALATIERNAKLQAQLIEDLLDVSRILRGKLSLNVFPVNLESIISAAMETVHLAAEAKSINFRFWILDFGLENAGENLTILANDESTNISNLEGTEESTNNPKSKIQNPKFQVMGDSARLQQIVWNLLSNAVKFTPNGGQVEIQLSVVRDRGEESSQLPIPHSPLPTTEYAQIQVIDTGKGINSDFLPYVFDYFRQADSATTRKFGGLGLGLAIVRQLVEIHGGTVFAESPGEGQGATFTVRLPLMKNPQLPALNPEIAASETEANIEDLILSGIRVLVVDDDADSRDFIAFVLEQDGAIVTAAASGFEALEILAQSKLDVLVSDIGMPEMDGYMLMRQVRSKPPDQGGQILAIALTAYAGEVNQQQAISAGFQLHLSKPVEPDGLVEAIAHLIKPSSL